MDSKQRQLLLEIAKQISENNKRSLTVIKNGTDILDEGIKAVNTLIEVLSGEVTG